MSHNSAASMAGGAGNPGAQPGANAAKIVNLEEIWETGAVLEAEEAVEEGAAVEIRSGDVSFAGRIAAVERHEFGWRLEMEFSPLTPWSPERFRPGHLLDPSSPGRKI